MHSGAEDTFCGFCYLPKTDPGKERLRTNVSIAPTLFLIAKDPCKCSIIADQVPNPLATKSLRTCPNARKAWTFFYCAVKCMEVPRSKENDAQDWCTSHTRHYILLILNCGLCIARAMRIVKFEVSPRPSPHRSPPPGSLWKQFLSHFFLTFGAGPRLVPTKWKLLIQYCLKVYSIIVLSDHGGRPEKEYSN